MTRNLVTLDRISSVEFSSSRFVDNAIQVLRAYQLYRTGTSSPQESAIGLDDGAGSAVAGGSSAASGAQPRLGSSQRAR